MKVLALYEQHTLCLFRCYNDSFAVHVHVHNMCMSEYISGDKLT